MLSKRTSTTRRSRPAFTATRALIVMGILLSAPFSFYPKYAVLALIGFVAASVGLAFGGSLRRLTPALAWFHGGAIAVALMLFFYHQGDALYLKFVLSLILSLQIYLLDRKVLISLREFVIYYGARGAALAVLSFAAYFAFEFQPLYRTLLPDERSLPFFGLTNINFGFDNPEIIIFARPAFLFDEPGQFAHFVVLLLALIATAHPRARPWKIEAALLVFAGFSTFSLAFFVVAAVYLATKMQKPSMWAVILAVGLAAYLLQEHPLMQALQWRLTANEASSVIDSPSIAGDNRSREIELAFKAFSDNLFWGAGWTHAEKTIGHFAANIVGPFGYSGLLAIPLYLPLLYRLYRSARAATGFHQWLVVGLVALFFSQRPYFYFPVFMLLMEFLQHQLESQSRRERRKRRQPRPVRARLRFRTPRAVTPQGFRNPDRAEPIPPHVR